MRLLLLVCRYTERRDKLMELVGKSNGCGRKAIAQRWIEVTGKELLRQVVARKSALLERALKIPFIVLG